MKIIGISGGSGAGKTTLATSLANSLDNSLLIRGDIFLFEESTRLEDQILSKIGVAKDKNLYSHNHYLASLDNIKTWISTIEPNVISRIKNIIENEGKNKDYIILDWCFLPLCDFFKECDKTICVMADYNVRFNRLKKRLNDVNNSNDGDESFGAYKPNIIENRIKLTAFNELGYKFNYYVENNGTINDYYNNINNLINDLKLI